MLTKINLTMKHYFKFTELTAELIATCCYLGRSKFAPGTIGSIAAFPICYIVMHICLEKQIVFSINGFNDLEQLFLSLFFVEIGVTVMIFIIGTYATHIYISNMTEKDPSEVVIDEVVGQMLTVILGSFSVIFINYGSSMYQHFDQLYLDVFFLILLPFCLFRLFDIVKPWPINWLDNKIRGALGVMIDDVAAAIFATVTQYVIVFTLLNFFPLVTS